MTSEQRVIWQNLNARFPGLSESLWDLFWETHDKGRKDPDEREFADALLQSHPEGFNLADLAAFPADQAEILSQDADGIHRWAQAIFKYNAHLVDVFSGHTLLPVSQQKLEYAALEQKYEKLQKDNAQLQEQLEKPQPSVDEIPWKRKKTLYLMILAMAQDKYGLNSEIDHNTVSKIQSTTERQKLAISNDTIRNVLNEAKSFLRSYPDHNTP